MSTTQTDQGPRLGLGSAMVHALAKNWWLLLLRGIAAIIFGLLAFAWPGLTLVTLILFYGAFALVDGAFAVVAAITGGAPGSRWWLAIIGLLGIVAGLVTFMMPGLTAVVLLYFIAGWAIATGVLQIIGAVKLRKEIDNEWLLILGGIISVLFGVSMMLAPGAGALALVWVIGAYSVVIGTIFVALALRLRKHSHS
ncbi:HdeD family acid-resistance protein [Bradyrhizobium sp. AUGA SZCCT0042]|uniref:HdeD family acid-resistance protein n=1 Tax=Bradyrhizobium sp. AUGA SZCCT0042 TaxID=2807651 RepID=UPI001BA55E64|nr:HdeD family acid-resistance protein [Bradyrhizobium sp. AUGA SZCCT0042]MBR1296635.1 HdeD family acid-resistance protein [Bradyrhizobium sp. AUGA SZCCT0042]